MDKYYTLFLLFMLYSIFGWLVEVTGKIVIEHKWMNRGFLIGPYCPIYGFGGLFITLLLDKYKNNVLILFFMSIIICSILEYLTSYFMEKIFKDVDNSQKNYDLLGGWLCHSPLQDKAKEKYVKAVAEENGQKAEAISIEEALLLDNFYFVAVSNRDVAFVEEFYHSKGKKVMLELADTVGESENPFLVYKVVEQ